MRACDAQDYQLSDVTAETGEPGADPGRQQCSEAADAHGLTEGPEEVDRRGTGAEVG